MSSMVALAPSIRILRPWSYLQACVAMGDGQWAMGYRQWAQAGGSQGEDGMPTTHVARRCAVMRAWIGGRMCGGMACNAAAAARRQQAGSGTVS